MKRSMALIFSAALLLTRCGRAEPSGPSAEISTGPSVEVADYMSIYGENNVEFYVMRVNDDYLEIPGDCNFVYTIADGAYPELENGQIARVTADVDIYDGGEAGYMGNYFIKKLHDAVILEYKDVVKSIDVPAATETEMQYGRHMLQYQLNDDLYFIVLNRQYIDVYLNSELFMEYEYSDPGNMLSPFFVKVKGKAAKPS